MTNREEALQPVAASSAKGHHMSTYSKILVFAAYAFFRSAKPSSSYLHQYIDAADEDDNPSDYVKMYSRFMFDVQPWGQRAQLLFYVLVVLFSSQIGYDKIVHMDYIFQFVNLSLNSLIFFKWFRTVFFLKIAVFVYGITAATSNVVHSYAYLVFEKSMFQKMTSISRGLTMAGHMAGSIFGNVLINNFCNTERSFTEAFFHEAKKEVGKSDYKEKLFTLTTAAMKVLRKKQLMYYGATFIISIVFVIISGVIANFFPKPEKEVKKGSNFAQIAHSTKQLEKRRVMFWALTWALTFMTMLYGKSWSSNLWKHHQNRLQQAAKNGLYDAIAYGFGFVGSFIPAYVVRLGDHTAIIVQLIIIAASVLLCILQAMQFQHMEWYYWLHGAFTLLLYYSLTYQNSELAKSIEHSQLKMVFNVLSFLVFISQNLINVVIDGIGLTPPKSIETRYMFMAFALAMTFLIIFIGFAGNVKGTDDQEEGHAVDDVEKRKLSEVNLEPHKQTETEKKEL